MDLEIEIRTEWLVLRRWREEDLAPFAAMNADPRVVEFLSSALTRGESDALAGHVPEDDFDHPSIRACIRSEDTFYVGLREENSSGRRDPTGRFGYCSASRTSA